MSNAVAEVIEHEATETGELVPAVADSGAIILVIERAARDPSVNVDKLERLVAMQERLMARQAEAAYNEAMRQCQNELPVVVKDAENKQTHSMYARLETVSKAVNPVIAKHGFSLTFGTDKSHLEAHYCVTLKVSHIAGHSHEYRADIPVDNKGMQGSPNKTLTHAFGSTISYGRRYLKLMAFDIVVSGEDNDGNRPKPKRQDDRPRVSDPDRRPTPVQREGCITPQEQRAFEEAMKRANLSLQSFLEYYGIEAIHDLPRGKLANAYEQLERARRAAQSRRNER